MLVSAPTSLKYWERSLGHDLHYCHRRAGELYRLSPMLALEFATKFVLQKMISDYRPVLLEKIKTFFPQALGTHLNLFGLGFVLT